MGCSDAVGDFIDEGINAGFDSPPDYTPKQADDFTIWTKPIQLDQLGDNGSGKDPFNPQLEYFGDETFDEVHTNMMDASDTITSYDPQEWADISSAIEEATVTFQLELEKLEGNEDAVWKGETYRALKENLIHSYVEPETAGQGAWEQGILVEAFVNTISMTKSNIVSEKKNYDNDLNEWSVSDWPNRHEEIKQAYDTFAQSLMEVWYYPNIQRIAENNPVFTAGETLEAPGLDPGLFDPNSPGGGGDSGVFDGPKPFTSPEMPALDATLPDLTNTTPTSAITTPSGLNGLTDPIRAASDAARNGLGPATDALKKAADGANQPFDPGLNGPPEGVLGLGPKGLGGSPSIGGAGGKTGAGAGTRLPRSFADARPTVTSSTRLPSTAGAIPGAGPGLMGPPGTGAPAGAPRGGDNGSGHQVLKALRRKKNGQDVAGDADAVVPVLGARERSAKPIADQPDQADHSATEVRPVPRGAHRPEQSTQVSSP